MSKTVFNPNIFESILKVKTQKKTKTINIKTDALSHDHYEFETIKVEHR